MFTIWERHKDALRSLRRRLDAQHHARAASASATERARELHVLQGPVENQPATLRGLRRADDLAVFGAPLRAAERAIGRQGRAVEGPIGDEILVGSGRAQQEERTG